LTSTWQQGKLSVDDKIYSVICESCGGFYKLSYEEIATIIINCRRLENIHNPPPKRGGQMLMDFLHEAIENNQTPIPKWLLDRFSL